MGIPVSLLIEANEAMREARRVIPGKDIALMMRLAEATGNIQYYIDSMIEGVRVPVTDRPAFGD
jgi:hypothetical protein